MEGLQGVGEANLERSCIGECKRIDENANKLIRKIIKN
jgi:hypothetical protein